MIIACPACTTRYAVPDSAIGAEGRTVRCAKCRHSWFQDGVELALAPVTPPPLPLPPPLAVAEPVVAAPPARAPIRTPAEAPPPPLAPEPWKQPEPAVAPRRPVAAVYFDEARDSEPPLAPAAPRPRLPGKVEDEFAASSSRFDHQPPFRPRRNPARLWMTAAIIFAVVCGGAAAAVARYGLPTWMPLAHSTFAGTQPDLVLQFPHNRQDRRTLPDGTEFFGVSGAIVNVGKERRSVPSLLIVLRDTGNRVVYSWEVSPAKRVLAPGESEPVIEAVTDIPRSAKFAEIGWKPG